MSLFQRLAGIAASELRSHVAVVDGNSRSTYADLVSQSAAFSDNLSAVGVSARDRVGVVLGNSREFLVAAFGIWKRGGILVPLNPQLREGELRKYVVDTSMCALVTAPAKGLAIQSLRPTAPNTSPEVQVEPEWPATTLFSTGSSGYPKRVTRSHGQLLGEFRSVSRVLAITPHDRILGVTPFFHNYGLMNSALLTLLSGATLYAMDRFLPADVARLIEHEKITGISAVPFMFQLLADLRERQSFSSLRFAVSAGAPLPSETAEAFERAYGIRIRQHYGSTETGFISIQHGSRGGAVSSSVGFPIPGVSVHIVDDAGRIAPTGTEGRVQISSPFAASAYDNSTTSNESCFTEEGFYPGDLGRMTPGGELFLCGRQRGFINVSGNKVDPTEVERVLLELPGITEVTVFGIPDGAAGEKVKAVLVAATRMSQMTVRAHCAQRLAEFKNPKVIEFRNELPRSPLGKILRKALMDPADSEAP